MFYEFYEGVRLIVFAVAVPIHKLLREVLQNMYCSIWAYKF